MDHCELIIRKGYHREIDSYSAFFENDRQTPTGLAGYLRERGLTRLFIVGLATDFCVAYSALDARRLGFEVTVIEAACRGIDVDGSLGRELATDGRGGRDSGLNASDPLPVRSTEILPCLSRPIRLIPRVPVIPSNGRTAWDSKAT